MPWDSKYRPQSFEEIVGQDNNIRKLVNWSDDWIEHKKAVVLYGPPGVGKTTSAHVLANEKDWEVIEMNASDKRTGDIIKTIAGESSQTASLTGKKRKLIILDEADNIHGNSDRGGKREISRTVKNSKQPIVLIANDYYDLTRTLRNSTKSIEFDGVETTPIAKRLRDICEENNIEYDIPSLRKIAENADGDLRAAINDLQKNSVGKNKITISDITVTSRDKENKIFPLLDYILKEGEVKEAQNKTQNIDMTPEELFRWLHQNILKEYSNEELTKGLDNLSKADIWLSRTRKTQNYKYWKYANDELTSGLVSARTGSHSGWTRWQPPKWNNKKMSDGLVEKIAEKSNYSIKTVRKEIIPVLQFLIPYCKPREIAIEVASWYELTESELSEITGSGKNTNKVQNIIADANEIKRDFKIKKEDSKKKRDSKDKKKEPTPENKKEDSKKEKENSNPEEDNQVELDDFI